MATSSRCSRLSICTDYLTGGDARPMTQSEIEMLQRMNEGIPRETLAKRLKRVILKAVFVLLALFLFILALTSSKSGIRASTDTILAFACLLGFAIYHFIKDVSLLISERSQKSSPTAEHDIHIAIEEALADSYAVTRPFQFDRGEDIRQISFYDDHIGAYLCRIDDGHTLYFDVGNMGLASDDDRYKVELDEDGDDPDGKWLWPCDKFSLTTTRLHNLYLGVEWDGKLIPPGASIEAFDCMDDMREVVRRGVAVFARPLGECAEILRSDR